MVENLHARFSVLAEKVEHLVGEHSDLRSDVEQLGLGLMELKARVDKNETLIAERLGGLWAGLTRVEGKFDGHSVKEETDRRWMFGLIFSTLIGTIAGLALMVARAGGMW